MNYFFSKIQGYNWNYEGYNWNYENEYKDLNLIESDRKSEDILKVLYFSEFGKINQQMYNISRKGWNFLDLSKIGLWNWDFQSLSILLKKFDKYLIKKFNFTENEFWQYSIDNLVKIVELLWEQWAKDVVFIRNNFWETFQEEDIIRFIEQADKAWIEKIDLWYNHFSDDLKVKIVKETEDLNIEVEM